MAVLHHKEEKIQAVLGRLPKKYNPDDFVAMFIKLYSKDWGKIKSAYVKASQDKEPGTVIHMPKPDLYLKQLLEIFLSQQTALPVETPKEEVIASKPSTPKVSKSKVSVKKIEAEKPVVAKKSKTTLEKETTTKTTKDKVATKKSSIEAPTEVLKKASTVRKKAD